MSNLFIAVIGAPRTGTSLVCDLVKKCGFNFGEDAYYTEVIRAGRNEHPLTRSLTDVTEAYSSYVVNVFKEQGINASKFHTIKMGDWLEVFDKYYNLKVVIIRRNRDNSVKSVIGISPDLDYYKEVTNMSNGIIKEDNDYDKFVLQFEDLLLKEEEPLIGLKTFLNSDVSIEELKNIIKPEEVLHNDRISRTYTDLET